MCSRSCLRQPCAPPGLRKSSTGVSSVRSLLAPLSSYGEIAHCLQAVQVVSLVQGDRNQMPPGTWDLLLGSLQGPQSTSPSTNGVGCHPSCFIYGQTKAEDASIVTLQAEPQTYNLSPSKALQGREERCVDSELAALTFAATLLVESMQLLSGKSQAPTCILTGSLTDSALPDIVPKSLLVHFTLTRAMRRGNIQSILPLGLPQHPGKWNTLKEEANLIILTERRRGLQGQERRPAAGCAPQKGQMVRAQAYRKEGACFGMRA